jgi:hypothetical protein
MRPASAVVLVVCLSVLLCIPYRIQAANLTTTTSQAAGQNWTGTIWKTNSPGMATNAAAGVAPVAGNTYETVFNGILIGNGLGNTRIRNPVATGVLTFPGDSLTMYTNTELRAKQPGAILNFPGTNANPGLILNGGMLNGGDDTTFPITGKVQVISQSYISHGANGGGGGVSPNRAFNFTGNLSGTGNMVIINSGTSVPQQVSGTSNTFSGQWIIQCGLLRGNSNGTNALGTNSITVDPLYSGYTNAMPSASSPPGPAWFEPAYDLNSAGRLTLTNGGIMILHQNCIFSSILIEGVSLTPGTHFYPELAASFPGNFASGGSGSLTVQPYGPPPPFPPIISPQPFSISVNFGSPTQLVANASGSGPLSFRWQKTTNSVFANLVDSGDVSGSTTNILSFSGVTESDGADYRLVVTNNAGATTSQVATITVIVQDTNKPTVATLTPAAGATVGSLAQIAVTFSENVVGVDAEDLVINGLPAANVTGTGSNYVFSFTQPAPGTIVAYWDIDSGISDISGNTFDTSGTWTYTLIDNTGPTLTSVAPADGSVVSTLTQAQVSFSEPVSGVDAADLLVNGQPATNVTGTGFGPYLFQFPTPIAGTIQFSWSAGHNIRDQSAASNLFNGQGWSVTLDPAVASALTNVVINEFLSANVNPSGLTDEDGQLEDWIELFNRGSDTVNLNGWSLTDDVEQPSKWIFPATLLNPGQYLVVFASGKDRRIPGANLHTSFSLNVEGEYLGLYAADFPPRVVHEFAPQFPEQRNDNSYGFDDTNALRYFAIPTPGGPNGSSSITGVVTDVHFSVKHGFFNQPFNLLLTTTTPGAQIIYTTNGGVPSISGGFTNGLIYEGPIAITNSTVVRAAAFEPDLLPSLIESRSYFFVGDIVQQPNAPDGYPTGNVWTPTPGIVQNGSMSYYQMDPMIVNDPQYSNAVRSGLTSIPTMSITLPIADLFDPDLGIYTHPQSRGLGWERQCSMELIFPDGSPGTTLDCGLQIQGGTQRDPAKNAKHSFRVNFKGDYGASKLNFSFFSDSAIESFNTLVLDGGINFWWHYVGSSSPADQRFRAQCVRDQYASDLMLALGQPSFHGVFYHVYLNGLYWGLHYVHERPDEDFAASYFGGNSADYDVLRNTTVGLEVVAGDGQAWNDALALSNSGLTNNVQYEQLQQLVDVDNLIDYMIVNHWVGNDDWPQHNWYVIRKRAPGEGFKFIIWDAEHILKDPNINRTTVNVAGSPAQIYNALRNNTEFRIRYADHLQKAFFNGGVFYTDPNPANALWDPAHPERNRPAFYYMRRINEITNAIVDEAARWGGYYGATSGTGTNYTRNFQWLGELNSLLGFTNTGLGNTASYFPIRSATNLAQYTSIGLFPGVSAPVFNQVGGNVPLGFVLTMTNFNSAGKIYYTTNGTDPRLYGSGALNPAALTYSNSIALNSSTVVKARVLNGAWSAMVEGDFTVALLGIPIRITELMYNPVGGDAYEFLELQNIGATPVDLSGFSFQGLTFVFPSGSILSPGGLLVLASAVDPTAFAARYPGVTVFGNYGGALSNNGERIALLDPFGNTVISVDYKNSGGWPTAADGGGRSLEIINPNGDPDDPANWRASAALNGSPGAVNSGAQPLTVRFNEAMAENVGAVTNGATTNSDWIELYNSGASTVSIANWSFSNSGNARKYVFPAGTTIAANGYLVVWCDSQTGAPGLHSGFTLGRKGENLFLYDANTNRIDAFSFGLQLTNYSIGRMGQGGWQLTLPTPAATNQAATVGAAGNLVLNEWLANSPPGAADWIELYNKSATLPIPLSGLFLSTSNTMFQIRSLSFIAPHDFVQLFADENPGFDHLDFKLGAAGDAIALYDYSGQQIDRVTFPNQVEGVSQGRFPNGSSTIVSFPGSVSPGASNYVVSYAGPILNEIMARNVSAIYDPAGNNSDWIELFNPTASSCSLAGMSLGKDSSKAGQWVIPAGVSIPANGYLVIWCSGSRAPSTNASTFLNTGFALNGGGGSIFLFHTNLQIVDFLSYGNQIADTSLGKITGTWGLMNVATPGVANGAFAALGSPASLRVNEWMANPSSDSDWFELYNNDPLPVSLAGLCLTDDPSIAGATLSIVPSLNYIAGHGWIRYWADNSPASGPGHLPFALDGNGETIRVYNASTSLVDSIEFGLQTAGVSQGRLPDGASNVVSFPTTPTPEASNYLPLENVFVNEVLSHTDLPLEDAIELYNPTSTNLSIGGWFISNSQTDFRRYRIPNGTTINAGGYKVFYEYQFNGTNSSPFTLNSAHGDQVMISEADGAGNLTGNRAQVTFGAAQNAVSFGRFSTSVGTDFVAMSNHTFGVDSPATVAQFRTGAGLTNTYPKVGPVVINEIMYHPITTNGTNIIENTDEEFIELFNMTPAPVPLYDPAAATNHWKISGAVDFVFPASVTMPAGTFLLVVGFDPATNAPALADFRSKYGISSNAVIYGPYSGHLNNSGETINLSRPDPPQTSPHPDAGFVPYTLVESLTYSNASPWPPGADATGMSLQRRLLGSYANEPLNWTACAPNPGSRNCQNDWDADGLPDDWELANGFSPYSGAGDNGANGDPDHDGFTNIQEFLAGTDPHNAASYLKIDSISRSIGTTALRFTAIAGRTYTLQYRTNIFSGAWQRLTDIAPSPTNTLIQVNDPSPASAARFYRLATPQLP